jgi:signal transduction histidine kinase/ligand-binding sensor domain-containing protein
MSRPSLRTLLHVSVAAVSLFEGSTAHARERVSRVYDERDGLAVAETSELAQDARGFIWIGTIGGLFRFDGSEMRAWAPDHVRHVVQVLEAGPKGEVIVAGRSEPLWQVVSEGVEAVRGPKGQPITTWVHATIAGDGALWVAAPDTLWRRSGGDWTSWPRGEFDDAPFYRVMPATGSEIFVATDDALWSVAPDAPPRCLAVMAFAWLAKPMDDGASIVLTRRGQLWRMERDRATLLLADADGGIGLAVRGDRIWATIGKDLLLVRAGQPAEIFAPTPNLPSGRPLLVDREGSLWIGGFRGVIALAEPLTVAYDDLDGLPSPPHAHHLARTPDAVWVVAWHGAVRVETHGATRRVVPLEPHSGRMRTDPQGRVWAVDLDRGFERWRGARVERFSRPGVHGLYGTSVRRDGSMWLATDDGLFLAPPGEGAPAPVRTAPPASWGSTWIQSWVSAVLEDRQGTLWLTRGETIASCPADSLVAGHEVAWRVATIPGSGSFNEILELEDGALWAGSANAGVLEWRGDAWVPLPGNRALGSLRVYGMTRARAGAWILTAGTIARVERREDDPAGWEIVEELGTWHGLPTRQASDLHEDPDGRLWLATLAGLVEVPPEARRASVPAPPIELVEVRVDGERRPLDRMIHLPWKQNRLEIRFAALSFRDRSRLRYQVRLHAGDPWRDSAEPTFRFVDLSPGSYEAQVRASLDGRTWTEAPAMVRFDVAPPWWRTPWAIASFAALLSMLALGLHRIRVATLVRLERQRLRIARDLHDEMGSGLGSIGILASLAADERVDDSRRREITRRIGETAGELGSALGELVQSLHVSADTLQAFAERLVARARRLVPGDDPILTLSFPDAWPDVRLPPDTQRELQAIAVEALHNAARHARARTIELGLAREGAGWRLWVRDDGRGIGPGPFPKGHGLENMRARAATMDAAFSLSDEPDGGTRVDVCFTAPRARRTFMRGRGASRRGMLRRP